MGFAEQGDRPGFEGTYRYAHPQFPCCPPSFLTRWICVDRCGSLRCGEFRPRPSLAIHFSSPRLHRHIHDRTLSLRHRWNLTSQYGYGSTRAQPDPSSDLLILTLCHLRRPEMPRLHKLLPESCTCSCSCSTIQLNNKTKGAPQRARCMQ